MVLRHSARRARIDSYEQAPSSKLQHPEKLQIPSTKTVAFPFHEPYPLTPSLSPTGGEGARRVGEGDSAWFMVPMRFKKMAAAHGRVEIWKSGFFWRLGFGAWSFPCAWTL